MASKFWPVHRSACKDKEKLDLLKRSIHEEYAPFFEENMQNRKYLSGQDSGPMMIDIHCFPFVERMVLYKDSPSDHAYDYLEIPNQIQDYVNLFRNHPLMEHTPFCKQMLRQEKMPLGVKAVLSLDVFESQDIIKDKKEN